MTEKKSKKEKAKGFFGKHKMACVSAVLVVVAFVAYVFFDYEIDIEQITNRICSFIGC